MRPLVKEWGANKENLSKMFKYVYENYKDCIDFIVPGGLRWTSGIEYALFEINNVDLPNLIKDDNKKTLDNSIIKVIKRLAKIYFPDIPLFFNSSCPLTCMLQRNNIALTNILKSETCNISHCPKKQREICTKYVIKKEEYSEIEKKLEDIGIKLTIKKIDLKNKKIITIPSIEDFNYSIKQIIIKMISNFK